LAAEWLFWPGEAKYSCGQSDVCCSPVITQSIWRKYTPPMGVINARGRRIKSGKIEARGRAFNHHLLECSDDPVESMTLDQLKWERGLGISINQVGATRP